MAEMKARMFTPFKILSFILLLILTFIPAHGENSIMKENGCIKKYNITRGTSPWQGLTSTHDEEEASKTIQAVTLKNSGYTSIPSLEKYTVSGNIIIGRSVKLRRIAVEASLFSELKRADVTRPASVKFLIGTYRDTGFKKFKPSELAEFLIESQIINTFWHIESQICLVKEDDSSAAYIAHYKGKHIYFTNSKNEDSLDFSIIIDKKTGNMFIETK